MNEFSMTPGARFGAGKPPTRLADFVEDGRLELSLRSYLELVMIRPDTLAEGLKVTKPDMLFSPLALPDLPEEIARRLVEAFPDRIESITLGKPTLEDVFIHFTGHRFWSDPQPENEAGGRKKRKRH